MALNFLLVLFLMTICLLRVESTQTEKWVDFYKKQIFNPSETGKIIKKPIKVHSKDEMDYFQIKFRYKDVDEYDITTYIKPSIIDTADQSKSKIKLYVMRVSKRTHDVLPGLPYLELKIEPDAVRGQVTIKWIGAPRCQTVDYDLDITKKETGEFVPKLSAKWFVFFALTLSKYFGISHVELEDMSLYPTHFTYPKQCGDDRGEDGHMWIATYYVRAFQNKPPFYVTNGDFIYWEPRLNEIQSSTGKPLYKNLIDDIANLKTEEIVECIEIDGEERGAPDRLNDFITELKKTEAYKGITAETLVTEIPEFGAMMKGLWDRTVTEDLKARQQCFIKLLHIVLGMDSFTRFRLLDSAQFETDVATRADVRAEDIEVMVTPSTSSEDMAVRDDYYDYYDYYDNSRGHDFEAEMRNIIRMKRLIQGIEYKRSMENRHNYN